MKVTVVSRSGREVIKGGLELDDSATVAELQEAIHKRTKKFYPSRQRLTLPLPPGSKERPTVLHYKKSLKEYFDGNSGNLTVVFKDLGPQVSYRTLFFFEYIGPLLLYPIFYYFPVYQFFGYKGERVIHPVQTYALYYWCFHYFKRIMETFFVHRFSHATSPVSNVFRNCAYYWTFGSYIAYYVNHPLYTPVSDLQMKIGFGFGVLCQISNFYCHILLKNLRSPDGTGGYQIPRGFLFNIVTCANYTTEIYQWLGFNIATQTVAGYIFLAVAFFIMTNWALAKHRRLKKVTSKLCHMQSSFHSLWTYKSRILHLHWIYFLNFVLPWVLLILVKIYMGGLRLAQSNHYICLLRMPIRNNYNNANPHRFMYTIQTLES
ncbi:hypothetical protein Dsin_004053 [Dipteronia sinensis]|uniref:3-oxo-5-alpha-steroid 4-dehydrogenase C-terminal domain-containing protein n=1 Tax=Dipteronia sinensis TaxID=43782 RepID=A0AAE0B994_9ROSI|nr:hypothetical protein Dsin_004053 [Dipteronia sinensis]